MEKKPNNLKQVNIREATHQMVKILAAETGRNVNNDLVDDLILFGLEEYRKTQKKFTSSVTRTRYKPEEK